MQYKCVKEGEIIHNKWDTPKEAYIILDGVMRTFHYIQVEENTNDVGGGYSPNKKRGSLVSMDSVNYIDEKQVLQEFIKFNTFGLDYLSS